MEVAIISAFDPNIILKPGGTRVYVLNLIRAFAEKGIKTTLVGVSFDEREKSPKSLFTFIPILKGSNISEIKFSFNLLLKAHGLKLQKSSIIHAQRPDLMLPFIIFYRKNPKVCTLHGIGYNDVYFKKGKFVGRIYRLVEKFALKHTNWIIAVDENTKNFYTNIYPWLKDKLSVIPVSINLELFRPMNKPEIRKKYGFKEEDKIILFVGRFEKEKGLDLLLESFSGVKKITDCKLVLVGNGREKSTLENFVNDIGLKDIIFINALEHNKIPEIMNCADVFALCSLYEGMPTVVLESLACGVPVVSTDVGDVHKVVKDDETGYILKTRDVENLKTILIKILLNNDKFKNNCITTAQEYSKDKIAHRIIGIYNEVLKRNK